MFKMLLKEIKATFFKDENKSCNKLLNIFKYVITNCFSLNVRKEENNEKTKIND